MDVGERRGLHSCGSRLSCALERLIGMQLTDDQLDILASVCTPSEIQGALEQMLADNVDQIEIFEEFLRELKECGGDLSQIVGRTHRPVTIEQFIEDDYFLGLKIVDDEDEEDDGSSSHKVGIWRECYKAVCEITERGCSEALFMGAIGIGKSTMAQILTAYDLYRLSCERYPQIKAGLLPGFPIVFVCLNVTDQLAHKVTFAGLEALLDGVPYFSEHFPRNKYLKSIAAFPHNISIEPAAAFAKKILGQNVIGGIVDELNFMALTKESKKAKDGGEFNQAKEVYTTLVRRAKSRFDVEKGSIGRICLVSSKGYPDDFTEQRKQEVLAANDGSTYVFDRAHWEVRPRRIFKRGTPFRVELGDARYASRVLGAKEAPRKGAKVISVPEYFKKDFDQDLPGALRDFAGIAMDTAKAFFYDRDLVWAMVDRYEESEYDFPFSERVIDLSQGFPLIREAYEVPCPNRPRACHVDLALSRDNAGLAVGFVDKVISIRTYNPETGQRTIEEVPQVVYDTIIAIKPPRAGQIEFAEVRQLIYMMRFELGIPIKWVTFDGFESTDCRQILRKRGFLTDYLSVEKLGPYEDFRSALYFHKRIMAPEHLLGFGELCKLEANYEKGIIDHPPNGSKDVADAMVGTFTSLQNQRSSWSDNLLEEMFDDVAPVRGRARTTERPRSRRMAPV